MRLPRSPLCAALAALFVAACAPVAKRPAEPPAAPRATVSESQLREKAKENLARGLEQYRAGQYDDAHKSLSASLDHGLLARSEQSSARKHLAFVHCVSAREAQCREEFRKALEIDPDFDLTAAEAGHPVWGPVYRDVRAQFGAPRTAPKLIAPAEAKPAAPRGAAEQKLDEGLAKYGAGEFDPAYKLLQAALKAGLAAKADQVNAHKHAAFSACLLRRFAVCRNEFAAIFKIEPGFDLSPAEAGHPSWAKTFAGAKSRAQAERRKAEQDAAKKKK